jgi:23S rRNA (cytosine1962-C5)-methyltransferase
MTESPRRVRLGKPLERALEAGHPWVWRNALKDPPGAAGDVVTVMGLDGSLVGSGVVDGGPIGVRLWTLGEEPLDTALFGERFRAAARLRDRVVPPNTTAYRLLHGEGDRAPGVTCDVYGDHAVLRFDGDGISRLRAQVLEALRPVLESRGVRSLHEKRGPRGAQTVETVYGDAPPDPMVILEHGMKLQADLARGQKTGLFLDQRESRLRIRSLAGGASLLNLYGYTGGFSVAAGLGGAKRVVTVDIAPEAVRAAGQNWRLNGLPPEAHEGVDMDVPVFLANAEREGVRFDIVISDPPNFAPSEDSVPAAFRSYVKLHAGSLAVTEPGGLYFAASCSSHMRMQDFTRTLEEGAESAGVRLQVLERGGAPADHPRLLVFPEGDYLKTVLCRRLE